MLAVFVVLERCNFIPNSMTAASRTQEVVGSFQSPPISRLYSSIADQIAHFPHKVIWQTLAPRVSAFIWQAWWGKINTFDRVQRKNPLLSLSPLACIMCFQGWESIIFSLVRLSNSIIRLQILENCYQLGESENVVQFLTQWNASYPSKKAGNIRAATLHATMWEMDFPRKIRAATLYATMWEMDFPGQRTGKKRAMGQFVGASWPNLL